MAGLKVGQHTPVILALNNCLREGLCAQAISLSSGIARSYMANTDVIKSKIHPYVRNWLKERYGVAFGKGSLPLQDCEGVHQFDAVSSDGKVAAEIKTASGKTSGGKHPSGKRASAFEQLYFLSLAKADTK